MKSLLNQLLFGPNLSEQHQKVIQDTEKALFNAHLQLEDAVSSVERNTKRLKRLRAEQAQDAVSL